MGGGRQAKFNRKQRNPCMLMTIVYNKEGVILSYCLPTCQIIYFVHYTTFLVEHLKCVLPTKRSNLIAARTNPVHDDVTCHKAGIATSFPIEQNRQILSYPLHSPDESPLSSNLFSKLEEPLPGTRYNTSNKQHAFLNAVTKDTYNRCLATSVPMLPGR